MKFSLDNLVTLKQVLSEMATGLTKLSFSDNFRGFIIEETILANSEISIRNRLTTIPTGYIIIKAQGNALVTAGDAAWTRDFVTLKNHDSTNTSTVKVFFFE